MCGILGLCNLDGKPVDPDLLVHLRDVMTHRGPDDAGIHIDGPVGLGHRRLAIVDLTAAGHQPMCNEDGSVWLVFNGEIYNYVELAVELERRGHRFRSRTDSEVIIHLYEEFGPDCVDHLNGMFAFVVWDARTKTLFGARDRVGIKPLYYYVDPTRFLCASEVKAILEHPAVPRAPDPEGMAGWLYAGAPMGGRTLFAGVRQLEPGHGFRLANGRLTTWKYWDVEYRYDRARSLDDTVEELAHLVDDAVRIHCRSDAPLGCHLSGGLDSSTVAALTSRHRQPVKTFSIRFNEGGPYDESRYARAVAEHVGAERVVATPTAADLIRLLPSLIWHMDAPLMPTSAFSYHTVSALASGHVKVSMTGHGGDEIFAGYPAQFQAAFGSTAMFHGLGDLGYRRSPMSRLQMALRRHGLLGLAGRLLRRALPAAPRAADTLEQLWMRSHCATAPADDPLLHPDLLRAIGSYDPVDEYLAPLRSAATPEVLDRCLYHDLRHYLPILLHAEDRVSMAVSLESRVPLLDHRIIEFLATVPPAQKTTGMRPKALLRLAARRWLPALVLDRRDKGPFADPAYRWLSRELVPMTQEVLRSRTTLERGVFDPRMLSNGLVERTSPWAALNLELWYRIFFDRDREWLDRIGEASAQAEPAIASAQRARAPVARKYQPEAHMTTWRNDARRLGARLVTVARTGWLIVGITLLAACLLEGLYQAQGAVRRLGKRPPAEAQESTAPWMPAYLDEQRRSRELAWHPYVYFRRTPFVGEFINVDALQRRVTVQAALRPDAPDVFLFGGSTLFGRFQRDAATIPSVLSRELHERHDLAARVTNFGESRHVFTQEVIELFVQLRSGITPRVVVFYNGINEAAAALQNGQPGLPLNEENRARDFQFGRAVFAGETDARAQARALVHLASAGASRSELFRRLRHATRGATPPPDVAGLADSLLAMYARTLRLVEAWAAQQGFVPLYVWQPTLQTTGKSLTAGERALQQEHDGDPQQRALRALHQAIAVRIDSVVRPLAGWRFVNLSAVFDTVAAPVFADAIGHTYEEANPVIVRALAPMVARALGTRLGNVADHPRAQRIGDPQR